LEDYLRRKIEIGHDLRLIRQSAGQMRPEDPDAEYKYRYVLMPMRI